MKRRERVLDGIEIGADLEPLGGVAEEVVGGEEGGEDGGEFGAVFEQPIAFENAGGDDGGG